MAGITKNVTELRRRGLTAAQAAALVTGTADFILSRRDGGEWIDVPPESQIAVDLAGRVTFAQVTRLERMPDYVSVLAILLRRLLDLDSSTRPKDVPGSLMVLMARALGTIDLPQPTLEAFRETLVRVVPEAPRVRADLVASRVATGRVATNRIRARRWQPAALAFVGGALTTFVVTSVYSPPQDQVTARPAVSASATSAAGTRPGSVPPMTPLARGVVTPAGRQRSHVRLVLADVDGQEPFSPSFSRDGHTIYFHTGRQDGRLMRADLGPDGSVAHVVPLLADQASSFHAVPSPDGASVAFDSDRDGVRAVYVADADGGHVRRVSGKGFGAVPSWSPDGRYLAFVKADANPRTWNVWIADVATGELRQVSHHRVGQAWGASWFPDGRRLAYSREDQLVIVDLWRSTPTTVNSPRPGHLVRTPAVSPDGSRVVFQVHGDGVWMLDVSRGKIHRVLTDRSAEEFRWSPDGRQIAYHARNRTRWAVWTLSQS